MYILRTTQMVSSFFGFYMCRLRIRDQSGQRLPDISRLGCKSYIQAHLDVCGCVGLAAARLSTRCGPSSYGSVLRTSLSGCDYSKYAGIGPVRAYSIIDNMLTTCMGLSVDTQLAWLDSYVTANNLQQKRDARSVTMSFLAYRSQLAVDLTTNTLTFCCPLGDRPATMPPWSSMVGQPFRQPAVYRHEGDVDCAASPRQHADFDLPANLRRVLLRDDPDAAPVLDKVRLCIYRCSGGLTLLTP
jgi:hypothetical protein